MRDVEVDLEQVEVFGVLVAAAFGLGFSDLGVGVWWGRRNREHRHVAVGAGIRGGSASVRFLFLAELV